MTEPGPASRIGRYQLVAPIGAGGMGRVWVALDTAAPGLRLVALKTTLGGDATSTPEFWVMLSDEASLASRIDHPNVCATYELGREAGIHFLVMEWSDGVSFRDILDATPGKRLSPELAALVCSRVAAGLHAAHELTDDAGHSLGVVHRDVSPQNILVSMRGHVRLADFGVAKARGQQHRATETGEVKGKLSYMAPEQITSKVVDRRADIFALGCVLYEATLGVRPFHGADAMATMYKILEAPLVTPREVDPSFPEALEVVLLKALAKDPAARYSTAEELGAALVEFLSSARRSFTDKHVAGLLEGELGDKLRERNRSILAVAAQLRRGETDPQRLQGPPATPRPQASVLTPEGGIERDLTLRETGVTRDASSWAKPVALVGLLLVAAIGTQRLLRGAPSAPPESPRAQAAGVVPPTPSAPAPVVQPPPSASSSPSAPTSDARPLPTHRSAQGSPRTAQPWPRPAASSGPSSAKGPAKKPRPIDRDNPFGNP